MASIGKDDDLRSFDVPEATRHSGGYTIYKIILQITPKELTENSYQLVYWKRYSDIRKLYDVLHRYHLAIYRPGQFPKFPEKSGYKERFNPAIVEERRIGTKQFLNFILQHLYLRTHDAYINFIQKGEKVVLSDDRTDTLKPEASISQPPQISVPILPTVVQSISINEKKDELLLNVDEEEPIGHVNNTSTRILEEFGDLRFEESDTNKDQIDLTKTESIDLISPPLPTAVSSNTNTDDLL